MKIAPPSYKREFISTPDESGFGYLIRFRHEAFGESPIGARLSKGNLPTLDRHAGTQEEADVLCSKWNEWLNNDKDSIHTYSARPKQRLSRDQRRKSWIG